MRDLLLGMVRCRNRRSVYRPEFSLAGQFLLVFHEACFDPAVLMRLDIRSFSISLVSIGETSWLLLAFLFLDFHMAHVVT